MQDYGYHKNFEEALASRRKEFRNYKPTESELKEVDDFFKLIPLFLVILIIFGIILNNIILSYR